ncbi:MAG TPA: gamma-glutamyl-gamma-aminobutyrate hydrolase family protein [Longimicrobiales bacterium]|nr:gamma-glutamyl-gamma-aminobutyrate hydrolase family protein [Longimicrobiales bacterium]
MAVRPLIGVPAQTLQAIDGIPPELPHSWVMNHRYLVALASVGAAPVIVPLLAGDRATLRGIYDGLDGIFLAGGVDVDPASYHEPRASLCGRTDLDRDAVEIQLAQWARADGKPILGACRGLQILNVADGGSLYQDCDEYYENSIKHDYYPTAGHARDYLAHTVRIEKGTLLHDIYGADEVLVNSMHHQGLKCVAAGWIASACAPDGLIEALEAPGDAFAVGVQWHPEMLVDSDPATRRLFAALVSAAAAFSGALR